MILTPALARAAALDAANKQMRKAGRAAWNEDDWNLACETLDRLTVIYDHGEAVERRRRINRPWIDEERGIVPKAAA